jgi:RNA polymerase sigma-70 factor, ECF subfamily
MEGKPLALVPLPPADSARPEPVHGDDDWMVLARNRRPGAFDALVRRYQTRALSIAYRYLGQRDLANDVAQNTFLEIYRRLDDYEPHGKFPAYFHRILLNQCRMAARSRRTRLRFHERLGAEPDESCAALPDEQILALERQRRIERGLLHLSEKLRSAVVLQFSGGLSQSEIAEVLDIKIGTVKSRVSAALVALRAALGEEP